MSNHHLSIVRKIKDLKGPARAVLIVLADRADDNGKCYPGMSTIARESGFSRSTVKTSLRFLKDDGWISWTQRHNDDGDLSSNLYTIDLGRAGADPPRAGADRGVGQEPTQGRAGAGHEASTKAPKGSPNEASKARDAKRENSPEEIQFANWFKSTLPEDQQDRLPASWLNSWCGIHDQLVRIDKRTPEKIREVCQWARTDNFWTANFRSPAKLRERDKQGTLWFDVLSERMKPIGKATETRKTEFSSNDVGL